MNFRLFLLLLRLRCVKVLNRFGFRIRPEQERASACLDAKVESELCSCSLFMFVLRVLPHSSTQPFPNGRRTNSISFQHPNSFFSLCDI